MSHAAPAQAAKHAHGHPYRAFALMMAGGTLVMFLAMYEMIDGWADFRTNLNMLYMALTMAAPMALLELALMGRMYPNRRLNAAIGAAALVVLVGSFLAVRYQAGVDDRAFLKSMIPHHSGAILMCREAALADGEARALCQRIMRSQREEIAEMDRILARLETR